MFRSNVSPDLPLRPKPPATSNFRPTRVQDSLSPGGYEYGVKNPGKNFALIMTLVTIVEDH